MSSKNNPWLAPTIASLGVGIPMATLSSLMMNNVDREKIKNFAKPDTQTFDNIDKLHNYIRDGVAAMKTKPLGLDPTTIVKKIRQLPFLPENFQWNENSGEHYEAFKQGPMSAYLQVAKEYEDMGMKKPSSTGMPALSNILKSLGENSEVAKPENIKGIAEKLKQHALDLTTKTNLDNLSPEQIQNKVYSEFDDYVKTVDPETWKLKQLTDWIGGAKTDEYRGGYSSMADPIVGTRDLGYYGGLGLTGLGTLGALLSAVRHRRNELEEENES